jgi:hypothetical protein
MEFKMNILGLIFLVGGLLALISIFLNWWSVSFLGVTLASFTGLDFITDGGGAEQFYMIMVLVLAIAAIVLALLEFMGMGNMIMTRIPVIVAGALIVVFSILTMKDDFGNASIGFYLAVIAGIVLLIAPLLNILKILPEE